MFFEGHRATLRTSPPHCTGPSRRRRRGVCCENRYTPRHASCLNRVEIDIGTMNQQCLDRRIAMMDLLKIRIGCLGEMPK